MSPFFSGGAMNLVYHVRSNILYPVGHSGLDGWALLWYEPWASDRSTALALWREAAAHIVRKDGLLHLDLNREWRIGATANYILSRAIANGSRLRDLVKTTATRQPAKPQYPPF